MEIITAEQARKMTNDYIPYDFRETIRIVMKLITDATKHGNSEIVIADRVAFLFDKVKTKKFKKYIESLGYKYDFYTEENMGFCSENIKISW